MGLEQNEILKMYKRVLSLKSRHKFVAAEGCKVPFSENFRRIILKLTEENINNNNNKITVLINAGTRELKIFRSLLENRRPANQKLPCANIDS